MDLIYHKTTVMVWVVNKIINHPITDQYNQYVSTPIHQECLCMKATCEHLIQIQAELV